MRSRTSRGVLEWLIGKDLYMGSHILGSGKRCSFFGIVPGSFQKVPEDSESPQVGPPRPKGWHGLKGGTLALLGQAHQVLKSPRS